MRIQREYVYMHVAYSKMFLTSACIVIGYFTFAGTLWAAEAAAVDKLLAKKCAICHQGETAPLGLRLDTLEGLLAGSNNGPVVVPGQPNSSELMHRVQGIKMPRMPMTGPPWLTAEEESLLRNWILEGADVLLLKEETLESTSTNVDEVKEQQERKLDLQAQNPELPSVEITYLDVAPILAQQCAKCHAREGLMGPAPENYRLTSYEETLAYDDRARVIPGNPKGSELLRRIRGLSAPRMPFDGPPYLSIEDINLISQWIKIGAPDSQGNVANVPVGARVRIEGILTTNNQIDDVIFKLDPETRIDKLPKPGDQVELRALVDEDGNLRATRLRRR